MSGNSYDMTQLQRDCAQALSLRRVPTSIGTAGARVLGYAKHSAEKDAENGTNRAHRPENGRKGRSQRRKHVGMCAAAHQEKTSQRVNRAAAPSPAHFHSRHEDQRERHVLGEIGVTLRC